MCRLAKYESGSVLSVEVRIGNTQSGEVWSSYVPPGEIWSGSVLFVEVRSDNIPSGKVWSGYVPPGEIWSGNVISVEVWSGKMQSVCVKWFLVVIISVY